MTLRQLWVRVRALPSDSPLHAQVRADADEAEKREFADEIDDLLNMVRKG